ncbi:MAG: glycosyltransferase family 4 protein [Limisphaerales bacterium]
MEWQRFWRYDPSKVHNALLTALDAQIQVRIVNHQIKKIIVISTYLESYYKKAGCNVVRIPPLIDSRAEIWRRASTVERPRQNLTLLFNGSWCRDRLDLMIEAVLMLNQDGHKVILEFLGCTQNDLGRDPKLQRLISQAPPGVLRFHGWVPREQVLPIAAAADFGILLRHRARWADACFPSKVAEFQSLGVPLLCNLTSDLDQALKDGENALIVPNVSAPALVATIQRALDLTTADKNQMRRRSLRCAEEYFDYRNHVDRLGEFIRSL